MIVAEVGTANNASALAGTSPSIPTKTNARTAAGVADVPPVATPGSSRLELLIFDRSWRVTQPRMGSLRLPPLLISTTSLPPTFHVVRNRTPSCCPLGV